MHTFEATSSSTKPNLLICVAGATVGSTGIALGFESPERCIVVRGPSITPLEENDDITSHALVYVLGNIRRSYAQQFGSLPPSCSVVLALSGKTTETGFKLIYDAVRKAGLGEGMCKLTWLTRGEACAFLSPSSEVLIVKSGTISFAHALHLRDNTVTRSHRVGGWGLLSGDDGGGYYIGRQLLYRLFMEQDGRESLSAFSDKLLTLTSYDNLADQVQSITDWIRRHRSTDSLRQEVSNLSKLAVYMAETGEDPFCQELIDRAASLTAESSLIAASSLKSDSMRGAIRTRLHTYLHGGLIQNSPSYVRSLLSVLEASRRHKFNVHLLKYSPVLGCLAYSVRTHFGLAAAQALDWLNAHVSSYSQLVTVADARVVKVLEKEE